MPYPDREYWNANVPWWQGALLILALVGIPMVVVLPTGLPDAMTTPFGVAFGLFLVWVWPKIFKRPRAASRGSSSRPGGTELRWVGWAFATFVLGLAALLLVALGIAGVVSGRPFYAFFAVTGAAVGYGGWSALRRAAALND